jgi:hypothetical protein
MDISAFSFLSFRGSVIVTASAAGLQLEHDFRQPTLTVLPYRQSADCTTLSFRTYIVIPDWAVNTIY